LYAIKAFVLLDGEGKRILAKFYGSNEFQTLKEQKALEKALFEKSKKAQSTLVKDFVKYTIYWRSTMSAGGMISVLSMKYEKWKIGQQSIIDDGYKLSSEFDRS
jgi:hypothetical protein